MARGWPSCRVVVRVQHAGSSRPWLAPRTARPYVCSGAVTPVQPDSIGPLAHPVAGRVIVAHPDLAPAAPRHAAAHLRRIPPHDLRVMPAHAAAFVSTVVETTRLFRPHFDDLRGRHASAPHFEQILAKGRVGVVDKLPASQQCTSPLPGGRGQSIGPFQRRHFDASPHRVMGCKQFGCRGGGFTRLSKASPLRMTRSGQQDENPNHESHCTEDA